MKILIAIHGSHSQPEQMQAQRDTWLKDLQGADYKFFLGQPTTDDEEPSCTICSEEDVLCGDFPDGPLWEDKLHRTWFPHRKTEALCEYALRNDYDFVFKCDDDTYVRVEQLLASGFEEHDYSGSMDTHYTQTLGWYRWAQGGAGYWLSRKAMEIVSENGLHVIPAEDFCVGNVLAANGIQPHHDDRYSPGVVVEELVALESPGVLNPYITLHKINPQQMQRLHRRNSHLIEPDSSCFF